MLELLKENKNIVALILALITALGGSIVIKFPIEGRVEVLEATTQRYIAGHTISEAYDKSNRMSVDLQLIQSQIVVIKAVLEGIDVMLAAKDIRDEHKANLILQKGLLEISISALQTGLTEATNEHRKLSRQQEEFRLEH